MGTIADGAVDAERAASTPRTWLAMGAIAAALGLLGTVVGLAAADGLTATWLVLGAMSVVYPVVGATLAARSVGARIGRVVLGAGIAMAVLVASAGYATGQGRLPGTEYAAWVASWAFVPALALSGSLLAVLFPDGSPPSGRWRPVVVAVIGLAMAAAVGYAFRPGPLAIGGVDNPFGTPALAGATAFLASVGDALFPVAVAAGAASMVTRYRRATADGREQIKWFAFAAVMAAIGFGLTLLPSSGLRVVGWALGALGLTALPIAIAVAVLRYRLYDIDIVINRTLVWLGLIGVLGGTYAAVIALLQRLFVELTGNTSDAAVILTTLILAGLFTPIRKTLESAVDLRFRPRRVQALADADRPVSHADLDDALAPLRVRLDRLEDLDRSEAP